MNSGVNSHPSIRIDSPVTDTTQLYLENELKAHKKTYVERKAKADTSRVLTGAFCHMLYTSDLGVALNRKSKGSKPQLEL